MIILLLTISLNITMVSIFLQMINFCCCLNVGWTELQFINLVTVQCKSFGGGGGGEGGKKRLFLFNAIPLIFIFTAYNRC